MLSSRMQFFSRWVPLLYPFDSARAGRSLAVRRGTWRKEKEREKVEQSRWPPEQKGGRGKMGCRLHLVNMERGSRALQVTVTGCTRTRRSCCAEVVLKCREEWIWFGTIKRR